MELSQELTLTLFELRVLLVDNVKLSTPAHNLALGGTLLDGCTYFHRTTFLFVSVTDATSREVIGRHLNRNLITRQYPDVVHAHLTRDSGQDQVVILKTDTKHGV